jgi:predicted CXXCH cytochrome family protein
MTTITIMLTVLFAFIPLHDAYAVHDESGKVLCYDCHPWLPFDKSNIAFAGETDKICISCHNKYHETSGGFSHPMHVVPSMDIPVDMPLDPAGRITCITCHSYHSGYKDSEGKKKFFMRRSQGKAFCYSCHKKRLF